MILANRSLFQLQQIEVDIPDDIGMEIVVAAAIPKSSGLPLRFTELMYNPVGGDPYEYLELQNTGDVPVDVTAFLIFRTYIALIAEWPLIARPLELDTIRRAMLRIL